MFIYEIKNKVDGKRYIGQSVDAVKRWDEHVYRLNNQRHENKYLQAAWNKYGHRNFTFNILDVCANHEELDISEINRINEYNTFDRKFGYNLMKGGSKHSSYQNRLNRSKSMRPEGYPPVVDYTGLVFHMENLREFARQHNLSQFGLRSVVVTKEYFHYKGWRLATPDTIGILFSDDDKLKRGNRISMAKLKHRYPDVISPDGTTYKVENLSQFCRDHSLSKSNMCQLLRNKKQIYKGWTRSS